MPWLPFHWVSSYIPTSPPTIMNVDLLTSTPWALFSTAEWKRCCWPRFEPEICLFVTPSKKLDHSNSQFPCPFDRNHFQISPHPLSCWVKVEWSNRHANTAHIPNNRSAFYSPLPLTRCQKGLLSFVPSVIQYLMGTSSTGLWGNEGL